MMQPCLTYVHAISLVPQIARNSERHGAGGAPLAVGAPGEGERRGAAAVPCGRVGAGLEQDGRSIKEMIQPV